MKTSLQWALEFRKQNWPCCQPLSTHFRQFFSRSIIDPETQHSALLVIESHFPRSILVFEKGRWKKGIFTKKRHNTNFTADSAGHNGHPDTDVLTFVRCLTIFPFLLFSASPHRTFAAPDSLFAYSPILQQDGPLHPFVHHARPRIRLGFTHSFVLDYA